MSESYFTYIFLADYQHKYNKTTDVYTHTSIITHVFYLFVISIFRSAVDHYNT